MDIRPSDLEERLGGLETRLEHLARRLGEVEKRLAGSVVSEPELEAAPAAGFEKPVLGSALPAQGAVLNVLTEVGRSCLVLGGAFLVRALTDSGILPRPLGAALGLAYAVLWVFFADRAAGRGHAESAEFLGITAVVIAYPLVVETSTRMAIFSASGAAGILVGLTILVIGIAYRRNLALLAWAALLAAAASVFVLAVVTGAVEVFAAAFLAIGLGSAWLAYAPRPWRGLRWPAAAVADFLMLWAALRLAPAGRPGSGSEAASSLFLALAFALPFLYLGTFAVRTLAGRRDVTLFEAVQAIGALGVGFGGAALVVRNVEDAQPTLGVSALLIAAGCYGVAFAFVEKRQGQGRNFLFYASLALLLTLWGSLLISGSALLGAFWCALALCSAFLATRFRRTTLAIHSAVYAAAAAWQTGLASASFQAFLAPARRAWVPFTPSGLFAVAASAAAYVVLSRGKSGTARLRARLPSAVLAVIVALGLGGAAVALFRSVRSAPLPDAGEIAAIRTAVLAAAALLLAAASRRAALPELAWLAYGVLALGGGKLLLEDLPEGRASTLFVGFAFYGAALLLAPRLLRRSQAGLPDRPAPA